MLRGVGAANMSVSGTNVRSAVRGVGGLDPRPGRAAGAPARRYALSCCLRVACRGRRLVVACYCAKKATPSQEEVRLSK